MQLPRKESRNSQRLRKSQRGSDMFMGSSRLCVCVCVCVCAHVHAALGVCVCVCVHTCMHPWECVCVCVCARACIPGSTFCCECVPRSQSLFLISKAPTHNRHIQRESSFGLQQGLQRVLQKFCYLVYRPLRLHAFLAFCTKGWRM